MAETFLYLTTTGHKTGLPRRIEIWYADVGGRYYLVSEMRERARWVKNIGANPAVVFSVGTRADPASAVAETPATARVVLPESEPGLARAVCERMDAKYGWSDGLIVELAPGEAAAPAAGS